MREIFLGSVVLAALVILVRRRRFDFFTVGFLSTLVYSLSSFGGVAVDVNFAEVPLDATRPVVDGVYAIKALLLVLLSAGALAHDATAPPVAAPPPTTRGTSTAAWWATGMAVVGLLGTLSGSGDTLFAPDKSEVMASLDRWFLLWEAGAVVGFLLAWTHRSVGPLLLCGALIAFHVFVGFRSAAALAFVGVFTLWMGNRGGQRLVAPRHWGAIGLAALVVVGFFVYKGVYTAVKAGAWDEVGNRLADDAYVRDVVIYTSEPFLVEGSLNEVVRTGFRIPADHYVSLAAGLIPFSPELGVRTKGFNDYFQPTLFPEREAGLASNFLAEAWAVGRWLAVVPAILVYVAGLAIGSRCLGSARRDVRTFGVVFFSAWAFFIHRNDLLYQAILERRFLLTFLGAVFLSQLVRRALDPTLDRGKRTLETAAEEAG